MSLLEDEVGGEGESGESCREWLHEHSCITVMTIKDRSDGVLISVEVSRVKSVSRKWKGGGRQSDWK